MTTVYKVGQPYSSKRHWPEGVDYNYRAECHELRIFMRTPSPAEIQCIETGPAEFAFTVMGDIVFFCYRFGDLPWGDCGFSIHLVPADERGLPPVPASDRERAALLVLLIDSENGVLKAMRYVSFSPLFTRELHWAITEQAQRPFPPDYDFQASAAYRRYPTTAQLVSIARARCLGGQ